MILDASHITGGLYQGSLPPKGSELAQAGFDVVVLTADEYQPSDWSFPGVEVLRLPMADIPVRLSQDQLRAVASLAAAVGTRLSSGFRVLVTCRAGLNRSGLVTGTYLVRELGMQPMQAVRLIRAKRSLLALNNPAFVHALFANRRSEHLA